jgi:hypothetical protein
VRDFVGDEITQEVRPPFKRRTGASGLGERFGFAPDFDHNRPAAVRILGRVVGSLPADHPQIAGGTIGRHRSRRRTPVRDSIGRAMVGRIAGRVQSQSEWHRRWPSGPAPQCRKTTAHCAVPGIPSSVALRKCRGPRLG